MRTADTLLSSPSPCLLPQDAQTRPQATAWWSIPMVFLLPDIATTLIKTIFPCLDENQLPSGPRRLGGERLGPSLAQAPSSTMPDVRDEVGATEALQPVPQAVGSRMRVGMGIHRKEHDGIAFAKDR